MPRIELLRQNTEEWRDWRRQGIGASDAPIIMGDSPFRTPHRLWSIKTGRMEEEAEGPVMRRGRALEDRARASYQRRTGVHMEPFCVTHSSRDWMRASLDGLSPDGAIVLEVKCPVNVRDRQAGREGIIPPHYLAQLQHQLEVSGAEEAHYWSFDGVRGSLSRVRPDREYIARMLDREAEFWRRVIENRWDENLAEELYLGERAEWRSAARRYRDARAALDAASLEEKEARTGLEQMAAARRTWGGGIEVLRSERRGNVDYTKVPELRVVDLEPYRKPPVPVLRINLLEAK